MPVARAPQAPALALSSHAAGGGGTETKDKAAARITGSDKYFAVTNLNAPLVGEYGFDSLMAVDVGVEIEDNKTRERAMKQMPRIRDSLRRSVRAYVSMSYEYGTVPDLEMLSRRLQRSADDLFGEGVADVTISAVLVHRYQN